MTGYYEKNRDKRNAYAREYYKKHGKKALKRSVATFRYGLTLDEYGALEEDQDWCCAVCKDPGRLVLDHNHTTGKARQFLCFGCNIKVGALESPLYPQLQVYLQRHA
jgi:hypothetical protein